MVRYSIAEIEEMILSAKIMIPIKEMFDKDHNHITKKEYGKVLLRHLVQELKEQDMVRSTNG